MRYSKIYADKQDQKNQMIILPEKEDDFIHEQAKSYFEEVYIMFNTSNLC